MINKYYDIIYNGSTNTFNIDMNIQFNNIDMKDMNNIYNNMFDTLNEIQNKYIEYVNKIEVIDI